MNIEKIYGDIGGLVPETNILTNESMKNHTSFKIGGKADILVMPSSKEQIIELIKYCKGEGIHLFVMGNGSNLLVSDMGIRGVVLKIGGNFSDIVVDGNRLTAETGVLMASLSHRALGESLAGIEFANGIPGTLGGALAMNAGAYGGEMKDVVRNVTAVDLHGNIYVLDDGELEFGYRTSRIQRQELIALEAALELREGDPVIIKETMDELMCRRREKQPLAYPSGGSVFKRPEGHFAGKLIQDAGLKGYQIGGAKVSTKHAGFIINTGNATCADVIHLIEAIQERVYREFGVELSPELRIVGGE